MRTALALVVFLPSTLLAQPPSPAGVAYRECIETAAVRYAHVTGSIVEAVDIALIACIKERNIYHAIHPPGEVWPLTVQTIREHLMIMVADERLKRTP